MEARRTPQQLRTAWWEAWRAADYSWEGLARKPWRRWSVDDEDQPRLTAGGGSKLRPATLQDFWRAEEEHLIEEPGSGRRWTRAHLPMEWKNGDWAKAAWSDEQHAAAIASIETAVGRLPAGAFDGRTPVRPNTSASGSAGPTAYARHSHSWPAPITGGVLRGLPADWFERAYLKATRVCFLEGLDIDDEALAAGVELQACLFEGELNVTLNSETLRLGRSVFLQEAALFSSRCKSVHAEYAVFAAGADFDNCRIPTWRFRGVELQEDSTFAEVEGRRGYFGELVARRKLSFADAAFDEDFSMADAHVCEISFDSAQLAKADFRGARFEGAATFAKARIETAATFSATTWTSTAAFDGTRLAKADFSGAKFQGAAQFAKADFKNGLNFFRAEFADLAVFDEVVWPIVWRDFANAFRGARFKAFASLAAPTFTTFAAFNGAKFDGEARFTKAAFAADGCIRTALAAARTADGLTELEDGIRSLRQAAEASRDRTLEHTLYRFELMARRARAPRMSGDRFLGALYAWTSGYGLSVVRPLFATGALWIVFGAAFLALGLLSRDPALAGVACWGPPHVAWTEAMQLSARSIFNLFGVWSLRPPTTADLSGLEAGLLWRDPLVGLAARLLSSVESVLAGVLLFLAALSVRRRFQIS